MTKKYSDYQIMVLEKAIEQVGEQQEVARLIDCSPAMITRVLKGERCLSPATCVKMAKIFPFVNIKRMSEAYCKNVIDWIIYKEKEIKLNINT